MFAARFVGGDLGAGSHRDYRVGDHETDAAVEHELRFQAENETPFVIGWDLPNRITGHLTDFEGGEFVDKVMEGTDSLSIADPSIQRLRMTVTYALGGNQSPVVDRAIGNQLVQVEGDGVAARLDTVFSDPDGDPLSYRVASTEPNVAEGAIKGPQNGEAFGVRVRQCIRMGRRWTRRRCRGPFRRDGEHISIRASFRT